MTTDPENIAQAELLAHFPRSHRPWQIMMTGSGGRVSDKTRATLELIFDRMPSVTHLTIKTTSGSTHVSRDYPSSSLDNIDKKIAEIFVTDPHITAIGFPKHTATPDDPHWSPTGKACAAVNAAKKNGEISNDEAIRRLKAIFSEKQENSPKDD